MNDFLTNGGIAVSLYSNMLTFRDSNKTFKLDGSLLETMTPYDFNVNHANPQSQKSIYEFAREMKIYIKQKGRKNNSDKSMIKLLESPAIMASGVSKTIFLSSYPDELCDRIKLLLREKRAGSNSDLFSQEIVAMIDKLLEYN